jgi:hypothetical protein
VTKHTDSRIFAARRRTAARDTEFFGGIWFKVFTERGPALTSTR